MFTTEYSCYSFQKIHSKRLAVAIGFGICALVFYSVNVYLGDKKPKELKGANPYFLAVTLLFAIWAVIIYFRRRFKITIYGDAKKLELEINDKELTMPITMRYPFNLSKQWIRIKNGKAYIKVLYLTFLDKNNEPIVTLTGNLGDLHDAPSRFGYINFFNKEDKNRLKIAQQEYATNVKVIEDYLNIHITYLNNRKTNS